MITTVMIVVWQCLDDGTTKSNLWEDISGTKPKHPFISRASAIKNA
jgi:hypothetical protein